MKKNKQSIVVSVRLDELALEAVDLLIDSGLENNRSKAVSYFIHTGVQASEALLRKARLLAENVQHLRNEMIEAVKTNEIERVSELLGQHPNLVHAVNQQGETAILMAAYYRSQEIKQLLLQQGAQMNVHEAAAIGNLEKIKELHAHVPDTINSYSLDGFTPLGLAAHFGNEHIVQWLLEHGADINARSTDGNLNNMALHAAIAGNHQHVVETLIGQGADVHVECTGTWREGFTPLHVAAYFGRASIIKQLLAADADRRALTVAGKTSYELALARGHGECAELLQI